ncbi:outer membrane protein assembly factor BamB family protein [Actinocorallia populi]|uniref:outer membrane protein assembly factor BamB family protein n=1 Tax=Actinocorallia populi TaxID=2079200 RepID=UPI001E57F412|nr:PQQ-binding-like beta-propeller repeat protein [Actinocorallia populi]
MSRRTDYLEHPGSGSGAKFYEVVRVGPRVTVTYGRVGKAGRTRTVEHATEREAVADAAHKVYDKIIYGRYVRTAKGAGIGRPPQAPVLWRFGGGSRAFGLFADERGCWVGNQWGEVYRLHHDGTVSARFQLPAGVKCIVADGFWIYAGCDDGRVYDLGGKVPRVAYELAEGVGVYWLDVDDGTLGVSLKNGRVAVVDHEGELQWSRAGEGREAWMVRCAGDALYYGDSHGVGRLQAGDGSPVWHVRLPSEVLFGWQERDSLYVGTKKNEVYRLAKDTGAQEVVYPCDASVFSCTSAPDGRHVFAGDNDSSIYCFDELGERLWKLATGCGSAYSMQYHDGRLYIATTTGTLACIDVTEEAVLAARGGVVPRAADVETAEVPDGIEPSTVLETATSADEGVVLECFEDGSRTRIRVVSPGYDPSWNVQFPKGVREPGARYLVEGVRPAVRGGFYRAYGDIRRLR